MFKPTAGFAAAAFCCTLALSGAAAAQQRDSAATVSTAKVAAVATDVSSAHHVHHRYHRHVARTYQPRYDYGIPAHRYWGPPYASLWPLPPIWPFGPWPFYY